MQTSSQILIFVLPDVFRLSVLVVRLKPLLHRTVDESQPGTAPAHPHAIYGPHSAEQRSLIPELRTAYLQDAMFGDPDNPPKHKHLSARHGIWYRDNLVAVPNSPAIKRQILSELHESNYAGHGGEFRTVQLVRRYFWWPSLG